MRYLLVAISLLAGCDVLGIGDGLSEKEAEEQVLGTWIGEMEGRTYEVLFFRKDTLGASTLVRRRPQDTLWHLTHGPLSVDRPAVTFRGGGESFEMRTDADWGYAWKDTTQLRVEDKISKDSRRIEGTMTDSIYHYEYTYNDGEPETKLERRGVQGSLVLTPKDDD